MNENKLPLTVFKFGLIFSIVFFFLYNSFIYINPGNVGIFINRLNGEVSNNPLMPGIKFKLIGFQDIVEYPIFMQTVIMTKNNTEGSPYNEEINVNSIEGQPISCDVSLSFELDPKKVPELYITFRNDIQNIIQGYVKQTIRQAMQQSVGKVEIANFLGKDKSTVVNNIQKVLEDELSKYGFIIKQFTLNEIRPPQSVLTAIENKNIMAQEALKSKNELKKVEFEAKQQIEEAKGKAQALLMEAKSQAEANKKLAQSLTPTLIKYKYIEKWNGKLSELGSANLPTSN
ncbi:MAG: hypothetical protein KatS3mg068_2033 [Candidatus Sericytochromatia bacterium]|nr:MAG: hypothetical protein KatS3mg068_2033 [Candidatus Sericytochromatia bacterium]